MAKKHKNFSTFDQWHALDVEEKLGIRHTKESVLLSKWIQPPGQYPSEWEKPIELYQEKLYNFYNSWNEQELMAKFIAPLLATIEWFEGWYNLFHERALKAKVGNYEVKGVVDGMLASGSYEPESPYFFIHEYKRMKQSEADPLGQLLIAMIAARTLNADGKPIYGCYIIGTYWRFVVLDGDHYAQSQGYDATDKTELNIIWQTLNEAKRIVVEELIGAKT
jgi:hypothetical protein